MTTDPAPTEVVPLRQGRGLLERDGLITPAELAAFLSVPVKTLRDWRYQGVGPEVLRVGRHVRYEPSEVRRWLVEDCTRGARTA
jgi:hypothetical protein